VVLSSQRVDTRDALYNATKGKDQVKNDSKNPLVQEGLKLIPSVTRVFSARRDMFVYLFRLTMATELPQQPFPPQ
jgi:hypothetical protein